MTQVNVEGKIKLALDTRDILTVCRQSFEPGGAEPVVHIGVYNLLGNKALLLSAAINPCTLFRDHKTGQIVIVQGHWTEDKLVQWFQGSDPRSDHNIVYEKIGYLGRAPNEHYDHKPTGEPTF